MPSSPSFPQNIRDKIVGDYNGNNANAFQSTVGDYVAKTAKLPRSSITNITFVQKGISRRRMTRRKYLAVVTYPASITYVITVNSSSHSLVDIESALTNLDILLDLQVVLRGITSVSIPTFVDLSPLSVVSQPSFVPSRSPSIFIASVGGGHLRVAQVQY